MGGLNIIYVILEILAAIVVLLCVISAVFRATDTKNPFDIGIVVLTFIIFMNALMIAIEGILLNMSGTSFYTSDIAGYITLEDTIIITVVEVFAWFVLYVNEYKRWYLAPLIISYFAGYFLSTYNINKTFVVFIVLTLLISTYIMLSQAVKNKHAPSFSLGIAAAMFLINYLATIRTIAVFITIMIAVILILSSNGYLDDKVFYDRKERSQIQNVWISKMIAPQK